MVGPEGGGGGRSQQQFWQTKGAAFFWDYSGIGILGIDGICVLLGAIPFVLLPKAEWTEWKEFGLLGIEEYAFFWEIFVGKSYAAARAGRVRRYSSSQVTSDSVSRSKTCRSVLFEIEIPCILLFLKRNKIAAKECTRSFSAPWPCRAQFCSKSIYTAKVLMVSFFTFLTSCLFFSFLSLFSFLLCLILKYQYL